LHGQQAKGEWGEWRAAMTNQGAFKSDRHIYENTNDGQENPSR